MKFQSIRRPSEAMLPRQFHRLLPVLVVGFVFFLYHRAIAGPGDRTPSQTEKFPRKIWQSWKVSPLSFETRDMERALTWTTKNPYHRYEVLTDENALGYVEQYFGPSGFNRPDVVFTYKSLKDKIIKADLLRYLIMYAEGGLYADIDVEALKPIAAWIPDRFNERDIDIVVGIETDEPSFIGHSILGKKAQSFVQWTFLCKPRLPVMMRLIDGILNWLNRIAKEQGKPISEIELDFDEVLSGTGPSAFTSAVLAEISAVTGEQPSWTPFHNMFEAKLAGRTLVLTVEAFAAGTGHSDSGNHGSKNALIKHHFHASSWPTSHPRHKHPLYGEVERCNWNTECVKLWDSNTAFFDKLPTQEQLKLIAMKELEEEEQAFADAEAEAAAGAAAEDDVIPPGDVGGAAAAAAAAAEAVAAAQAPIGESPPEPLFHGIAPGVPGAIPPEDKKGGRA
ncbi:hypothetical protein B0A52_09569 [Exophiala mesophila]|uniref:Initiation-specific alpha-1,6-mannosyltransferase n=1 Tax=Exophiala mesophila TaxID=212818 RepID=A0A438MVC6_EXOME|nr:hypothetical protein B0A52_09569 [Exophiala mesophila]